METFIVIFGILTVLYLILVLSLLWQAYFSLVKIVKKLLHLSFSYDKEHGLAYIYFDEDEVTQTIEVQENLLLDFNKKGEVIGIEFLNEALIPNSIKEKK